MLLKEVEIAWHEQYGIASSTEVFSKARIELPSNGGVKVDLSKSGKIDALG